ncbi:MAG: hypothetical protein HN337_04330 [Deltaproteobacteria bacterium]|nr:hypothetical protein [Deltaproteobacteria bacterium]
MEIFKYIFVIGRPAAGKSEFIDFMKKLSVKERSKLFHVGNFEEIDDFPWLCEACDADDKREKRGEKRLHTERTDEGLNLLSPTFRSDNQIRFNEAIQNRYGDRPQFFDDGTLLIEFARGKADGFKISLERMSSDILQDAAILYIDVSFDESFRRNDARFKAAQRDSILFHKVPDKDMYEYFIENDWKKITEQKEFGYLELSGMNVPFFTMLNEPESKEPSVLTERYGTALSKLWELKNI